MVQAWVGALLAFAASLSLAGCAREEERRVSLESHQAAAPAPTQAGRQRIRFAVGGMITPKEGMGYYRDFLRYVGEQVGVEVEYVDREGYAEINKMLKDGQLEAAFVCSGPYVDGRAQFGLELLAAPQAYGATTYHSYIIVPKSSPVSTFAGLRGKRFAFTDPLSNSGTLVPTYMLARSNETPQSYFKETVFTGSHDKSIKAVAQGIVDGAAVDSLIWEYLRETSPEQTAQTRIIERSPPYGIPPLVVPPGLDPVLKEKLRRAVLGAHAEPKGIAILARMKIDRFVEVPDSAYDSVREMQAWVAKSRAGK